MTRHIAMWSCPRSCSSVIARSFEQLPGCYLFDEPFYGPYLLKHGLNHPGRQDILDHVEPDYRRVIPKLTGDLPGGFSFMFQKHIARQLLPEFEGEWLGKVEHFFLIRDLKKIIISYQRIYDEVTLHDIGIRELYNVFQKIKCLTGKAPTIVLADDLLKDPAQNLSHLCSLLNLKFSKAMLHWERGAKGSKLLGAIAPEYGRNWYSVVINSDGFLPRQPEDFIEFPHKLTPLLEEAKPYYQELYDRRVEFSKMAVCSSSSTS